MTNTKKNGFHTVSKRDEMEYEKQLKEHRIEVLRRNFIGLIILLLFVGGTVLYMSLRQYTDYDILTSVERADTKTTQFCEFQGNILKYSNDGAFYTTHDNERIWNQTYELSKPMIDMAGSYLTIYDKKGTDIFILNKNGLVRNIKTNYPIIEVSIAGQGTIAVLMDSGTKSMLTLYDKEGNILVNGAIHTDKGGYPTAIALSEDGIKLGVAMLDTKDGSLKSAVAFYNFGSVGENTIDHIVSLTTYEDTFITELDFVSKDCMVALADTGAIIFEGSQKPQETERILFEEKVKSIFQNDRYLGTVSDGTEEIGRYLIRVYDLKGRVMMEIGTDIEYSDIQLLNRDEVCILSGNVCDIYTIRGVYKFHYEFEKDLYHVISGRSSLNYTFILNGITEQARLK